MKVRTMVAAFAAALTLSAGAQALETSVAPKVTQLNVTNPTTGMYVGNSYSFYNCGVHSYVRGFAKEDGRKWKARIITISSGMLSFHDLKSYLTPHEMDPYFKDGNKKPFDVILLQGMSSEPIDKKRIPTFKKYLKEHVDTIRASGAEPIVVVTWAKQDKPEDTRRLADSIIAEANANNAIALPVGLAFAESLKARPDLILHQKDKSHPTAPVLIFTALWSIPCFTRSLPKASSIRVNAKSPSRLKMLSSSNRSHGRLSASSTAGRTDANSKTRHPIISNRLRRKHV